MCIRVLVGTGRPVEIVLSTLINLIEVVLLFSVNLDLSKGLDASITAQQLNSNLPLFPPSESY